MPLYVLEAATLHIDDVEIAARDVSIGWPDLDLWLGPRLQFRLDGIESPGRIARLFAGEAAIPPRPGRTCVGSAGEQFPCNRQQANTAPTSRQGSGGNLDEPEE